MKGKEDYLSIRTRSAHGGETSVCTFWQNNGVCPPLTIHRATALAEVKASDENPSANIEDLN